MLIASCLALWLTSAAPALAADAAVPVSIDATLRSKVLDLVSGYEDVPSGDELRKLGTGVDAALMDIAQDASVGRAHRASATWSLGFFPTDTTQAYLLGVVGNTAAESQLRRSATWALCNGWGDAALPAVAAALASDDVQLRNQAVRAIARVGTPAALAALQTRLGVEPSSMVRDTINQSLTGFGVAK